MRSGFYAPLRKPALTRSRCKSTPVSLKTQLFFGTVGGCIVTVSVRIVADYVALSCQVTEEWKRKVARDFYEHILDQKVKYDFGESVTFQGDFAIHLQSHYKNLIDNREVKSGGNNFELYFESDTIELMVEKLKKNKILLVHELREQPWRQKVVRLYDPDGNIIEIGETLEHLSFRLKKEDLSFEQISEIINMPMDFVIDSIKKYEIQNK